VSYGTSECWRSVVAIPVIKARRRRAGLKRLPTSKRQSRWPLTRLNRAGFLCFSVCILLRCSSLKVAFRAGEWCSLPGIPAAE